MRIMTMTLTILMLAMLASLAYSEPQNFTSITEYLPEDCPSDGSVDLTEQVKQALAECSALYFPGSNNPEEPWVYALRPQDWEGIKVRSGTVIEFGPNSLVRRLPSQEPVFNLGDNCRISGAVIDGNKYGHWPEFQDMNIMTTAIRVGSNCVVTDCFVYNNPGSAFSTHGNSNKFIRCRAENVGYIDVKFGADFYQGEWNRWSADGFYIAGEQNLVRDCEAFDCFRWDFNSSHPSVQSTTFVDCRGGDVNWRTYGFVDFENSGPNNRLIRCYSPNSAIWVSSPHTQVIDCVASGIFGYEADYITIRGCTTTGEGIALGWTSAAGEVRPGGKSPVITGNRIFMARPSGMLAPEALHVMSEDGRGIVAGNIIYAYEGDEGVGAGIWVQGIEQSAGENQVIYGQWNVAELYVQPRLLRGSVDWDHIAQQKATAFEERLSEALPEIGLEGEPAWKHVVIGEVPFALDDNDRGVQDKWFLPDNRPETRAVRVGWPWNTQIGDIYVPGWYFIEFNVPAEYADAKAWLYFGGVDSHATVWLNGKKLGEHEGWDESFSFEVTGKLSEGVNQLVVRAETSLGLAGIYEPLAVVAQ